LSADTNKNIFIWRDDLTDFVASGNKVRKLEYLLADALSDRASAVITCGGVQSNHARATAYLARRMGLKVSLILREPPVGRRADEETNGNLLLNFLCKSNIEFISYDDYKKASCSYDFFLAREKERLTSMGENVYLIPEGGSNPLGCFGYINAVNEMLSTWKTKGTGEVPDAIFCALGSGATFAGLVLGLNERGFDTNIVRAVNVCNDREYFNAKVKRLIEDACGRYDLKPHRCELNIIDGFVGEGYAKATDGDLSFYSMIAHKEGVLLDPCYTGKAFRAMIHEITNHSGKYGRNILFLHSGGTFATFNYARQYQNIFKTLPD
ncbi:MAG: pyridoxal-phosphate dependent enzyme, partial [Oligoflexales bacterium]|nr:pyridoxal-phosphate dependent enzyme [Oligoflexales bacterium]